MRKLLFLIIISFSFIIVKADELPNLRFDEATGDIVLTYKRGTVSSVNIKIFRVSEGTNFKSYTLFDGSFYWYHGASDIIEKKINVYSDYSDLLTNNNLLEDGKRIGFELSFNGLIYYLVLEAKDGRFFELPSYKVTFVLNGGNWRTDLSPYGFHPADEMGFYYFQTINLGDNELIPEKGNLYFAGWYTDPQFKNKKFSINNISEDITLYAKWMNYDDTINVRFEDDNGELLKEQTLIVLNMPEEPEVPIKDGYSFVGWCVVRGEECSSSMLSNITFDEDNMVLRAFYVENSKVIRDIKLYIRAPYVGDVYTFVFNPERMTLTQTPSLFFESLTNNVNLSSIGFYTDNGSSIFNGTIVKDKKYKFIIRVTIPDEIANNYYFDYYKNLNIIINGKHLEISDLNCYNSNTTCSFYALISSVEERYAIIDGDNQSIFKGSELTIRIDGDPEKFKELKVDDTVVDEDNYIIENGSTIVTLNNEYINTLDDGNHSITFIYDDGDVSTLFDVSTIEETNNIVETIEDKNEDIKEEINNTNTSDRIIILIISFIISILLISYLLFKIKKHSE
jgi:uncharacterized repeat protein (TIGR02543 family)